ncbi:MAG: bifunctional diguanylate cyclase/phosphodiesterase [Sulfurospirillaceae bacterium]|nr:bifunctional diguanylate cyclase/phosphodiesterase [Sulfurospirillaceae bacterium]MDD2826793.1 bifunctional diguanylate cyclase/phosphodiesterase [Sulfurospirillaceae bacterium]
MGHIINKVLFKYIILLLLTFFVSIASVISLHFFFYYLGNELIAQSHNLKTKIEINRQLLYELSYLHTTLLEMGAATTTKKQREDVVHNAERIIATIEEGLFVLNNGGVYTNQISQNNMHLTYLSYAKSTPNLQESSTYSSLELKLQHIHTLIREHTANLDKRDLYFAQNNPNTQTLIQEIRVFNKNFASLFDELRNNLTEILLNDSIQYSHLEQQSASKQTQYHRYEFLLITLSIIVVLVVLYNILLQIINLYKELENKLYVDSLTKLNNRILLLQDIKKAQNPAIIIIDINSFRTINELYGVEVGNEVLIVFATVLKTFAQTYNLSVYRIAGDEFVLYKDLPEINYNHCISLLSDLFKTVENKKIYITTIENFIYLDLCAGISFEKNNALGTADIALNRAKELHKEYVFYDKALDSMREIKQGAQWKKRIIEGIEKECFVPFFQPIVDRHQNITKYEALMRLEETDINGEVSYISPASFLEIASQTRHYNQISSMTLLRSFRECASHHISISVNLNYHDILNKSLHAELKKFIIAHDIGKFLIFEIVESENIQNYKILKHFMNDFRLLGVRFAIDDFGTGFSNFSHIFELAPDYIKIDGSLIQNIHTDKKSYELVKAIVFFSKELGIHTVAEYIHCQEVFDIAYKLGIDEFQGYYFGEPKIKI